MSVHKFVRPKVMSQSKCDLGSNKWEYLSNLYKVIKIIFSYGNSIIEEDSDGALKSFEDILPR